MTPMNPGCVVIPRAIQMAVYITISQSFLCKLFLFQRMASSSKEEDDILSRIS